MSTSRNTPCTRVAVIVKPDVVSHGHAGTNTALRTADFLGMRLGLGDLVLVEPYDHDFLWCQYAPGRFGIVTKREIELLGDLE